MSEDRLMCKHGFESTGFCPYCRVIELEAELAAAEKKVVLYERMQQDVLKLSREWDEHPEDWDWPCACRDCRSGA